MNGIHWPQEYAAHAEASVAELGGKGSALALLSAAMPVPPWFVVGTAAFAGREPASGLPPTLMRALERATAQLCGPHDRLAVRSSAPGEDSAGASFAGQLESYLFVAPGDVPARVADVWRSAFSERVVAYRRERGLAGAPAAPAVVVQKMIDADVAGVAFSADPVSGRRDLAVVSAVLGLGTALVSGEADADTYHVDCKDVIRDRTIAHKTIAHRRSERTTEGVEPTPVAAADADRPALGDSDVRRVVALARQAEQFFRCPQDIEWALKDGRLYLLQSRPITTLHPTVMASAASEGLTAVNVWDNSNIAESFGGVTTPLTFSFAKHAYEGAYRQFCRLMRIPEATIAANDNTFRHMLGLIRGRVYYNLLNWYRVLALLPGYTMNSKFMEQMMGVKEPLRDGLIAPLPPPSVWARAHDGLRCFIVLCAFVGHFRSLPKRIAAFYAHLHATLGPRRPDFHSFTPTQLAASYRDMEGKLLTRWDAPLINDLFTMIFFGGLRRLCVRWCGDTSETLQNALISGEGGMISAEPAQRILDLAALAARDPRIPKTLASANEEDALAALALSPPLQASYRSYLEKFGDRTTDELKLETPTLFDDPTMLLRAIGRLALAGGGALAQPEPCEERRRAERLVASRLAKTPLRRMIFGWVLRHARARVVARENLRFERTRLFGRMRSLFAEFGRQFAAAGVLENAADVFYLEVDEVLGFVEGTATTTELGKLAALRKAEFDAYRGEPAPPDRFETVGPIGAQARVDRAVAAQGAELETRHGLGCCPGVVRGTVRVVIDPRNAELVRGDILVAERTDPGWVMLFPAATGLLVERGSLLSHSAIVAREMRLPAVVSVPGLMRWLHDGDVVEFDGGSGRVQRVEKSDVHA